MAVTLNQNILFVGKAYLDESWFLLYLKFRVQYALRADYLHLLQSNCERFAVQSFYLVVMMSWGGRK